ncbi:MAG: transposase [Reyranellaceae bacterium]
MTLPSHLDCRPAKQHVSRHSQDGLWCPLEVLPRSMWPRMVRGDDNWGTDLVMQRCEEKGLAYLLRLRLTANVKRALDRAMSELGWTQAGQGWQGKEAWLKLHGWNRARRVILLRQRLKGAVSAVRNERGQLALGFANVEAAEPVWEHGALATSLREEILSFGQLYRDRADCENVYDEMKNQWGWGGFTTHDLARCQLMARIVALTYNWRTLFARLAEPDRHREAITARPLMMHAIARCTEHAGRTTLTITSTSTSTSTHGNHDQAKRAYRRIARFFANVRATAEQLTPLQRLYRIPSEAMRHFLNGRLLRAPPALRAARHQSVENPLLACFLETGATLVSRLKDARPSTWWSVSATPRWRSRTPVVRGRPRRVTVAPAVQGCLPVRSGSPGPSPSR